MYPAFRNEARSPKSRKLKQGKSGKWKSGKLLRDFNGLHPEAFQKLDEAVSKVFGNMRHQF